jgi:hydroxylysine kinase
MDDGAGVLEQVDPELSEADAARLADEAFGVAGRAERLTGERDQNFRLIAADGGAWLLKISNSAEPAEVTDLQTQALLHIAAADPTLPMPRVRPARDGSPQHLWTDAAGRTVVVRLLSYLEGRPLYRAQITAPLLAAVGASLARLDRALADFRHPAEDYDLLWDIQHAARLADRTPAIDDLEVRRLTEAGLAMFGEAAAPRLPSLRRQFIHNDLNPHNLLVAEDGAPAVNGIIDLGDAVRAPLIDDLAVAAAYQVDAGEDPLARIAHLVGGYHAVLPLRAEELEVLGPLIVARMSIAVAISSWRAKDHPENRDYIVRNLPAAVRGLRQLLPLPPGEIADRLRATLREPLQ